MGYCDNCAYLIKCTLRNFKPISDGVLNPEQCYFFNNEINKIVEKENVEKRFEEWKKLNGT